MLANSRLYLLLLLTAIALGALAPIAFGQAADGSPAAPAWLGEVDKPGTPGSIPPPRAFRAVYRIHWGDVDAARAEATFQPLGADELQTRVTATTLGMARSLWQMDATHVALARRSDLRPLFLEQTENYSSRQEAYRVDFDAQSAVRRHQTSRNDEPLPPFNGPPAAGDNARRFSFPGLRDMETAFLYFRSQPLADGETHVIPVMSAKNPYLATARVVQHVAALQVKTGRYPAIELELHLQRIEKDGRLRRHKQFKSARVWISNDADRLLLKAEARIFIGSVVLELDQITFPADSGQASSHP